MKIQLILAIALASSAIATAQKTDATFNSISETYTLNSDGSTDYDYSKSLTFHTQHSFNSLFGETFIVYNPDFQKLKINECYTVQKDGTRIDAPDNAFNESLPSQAANSALYNNLREMVVTHTGLETGATTHLSYSMKSNGRPTIEIDKPLGVQGADIKEYKITVKLPEGKKLNWETNGSDVKPVVKNNTYTWTFRNIPADPGDAFAPASEKMRIRVTTEPSLAETLKSLNVETADKCRLDGVVADTMNVSQKTEAIHKFMTSSVATGHISPTLNDYRLNSCREVISRAYGTEAEKASAMAALLRSEGVDAEMVVVFPKNCEVKTIPAVTRYLVKADGKIYDPSKSGEYNAAIRADRDDIFDLSGNLVDIKPATVNITCSAVIDLSADSISVKEEKCEVKGLPGEVKLKAGNLKKSDGYVIYTVGNPSEGIDSWGMSALQSSRKDAFEIPYPVSETCTYTINTEGLRILSRSTETEISNAAGRIVLKLSAENGKVVFSRHITLNKSIYSAAEYAAVRELLVKWQSPAFRKITLKTTSDRQ